MSAAWHLDRLAAALTERDLCTEPRYGEDPPLLRVWYSDVPVIGESVSVVITGDERLWFQSSDHRLLAPVGRPVAAAAQLIAFLHPYRPDRGSRGFR